MEGEKKMWKKRLAGFVLTTIFTFSILVGLVGKLFSDEEETVGPNIGGFFKELGILEVINDNYRNRNRIYLFIKNARLNVTGKYQNCEYKAEAVFGPEELPKSNSSLSLLDFYVDVPIISSLYLRAGQFKVPYSRERLADAKTLQFAERSINTLALQVGRDYGFVFHGYFGKLAAALGIVSGAGPDIPVRYIPQVLNVPMVALRVGLNNALDKNIFNITQTHLDEDGLKYAVYFDALYSKDSRVGHSSALSSRLTDISLLLNKGWNPFLRAVVSGQVEIGNLFQTGLDFALQKDLGNFILTTETEFNYGQYENNLGTIKLSAGMAKFGVYFAPIEMALRYGIIIPDPNMGYYDSTTKLTWPLVDSKPIHEITPAMTIYFKKHNLKLIFDLPIGIDVPVGEEVNLGSLSMLTQPDNVSFIKNTGKVGTLFPRQNTVNGRMILQFSFK